MIANFYKKIQVDVKTLWGGLSDKIALEEQAVAETVLSLMFLMSHQPMFYENDIVSALLNGFKTKTHFLPIWPPVNFATNLPRPPSHSKAKPVQVT